MNASNLPFSEFGTTDVKGIDTDGTEKTEIYTVSGIRMTDKALAPGIYIQKTGNKTTKKAIR